LDHVHREDAIALRRRFRFPEDVAGIVFIDVSRLAHFCQLAAALTTKLFAA
jgi:hypothetical protein